MINAWRQLVPTFEAICDEMDQFQVRSHLIAYGLTAQQFSSPFELSQDSVALLAQLLDPGLQYFDLNTRHVKAVLSQVACQSDVLLGDLHETVTVFGVNRLPDGPFTESAH
ncbi:hypothetical protein [Brevibacillus thermoruber]|uniref:hypothetical protein n=1 Tax=Brevibacillus thermoruber TaxID=33942 RepID=UPI0018CD03F3|nr:hypothetical protein [Brevibacillus thermoruber]